MSIERDERGATYATAPGLADMRLKVGVMGGASGAIGAEVRDKAHRLGVAIAKAGCVLITGACPGLPLLAACGARRHSGLVVGISPALSLEEHVEKYGSPTAFHDVLVFTGSGLMGREVVNIRTSDVVVIIGGRSGTLGELAIAYDEGKLIGVLTHSGGISDLVEQILAACGKDTGARLVYDDDPDRLVAELLRVYDREHYRRPSCFSRGADGGPTATDIERDPVCGMSVTPDEAATERVLAGRRHLFCSRACAERFDELAPETTGAGGDDV